MEDESKIIKKVDTELRKFIGQNEIASADQVFNDPALYRRVAERFWKREVVKAA